MPPSTSGTPRGIIVAPRIIDLAARCGNTVTLETAPNSSPAQVATTPADRAREPPVAAPSLQVDSSRAMIGECHAQVRDDDGRICRHPLPEFPRLERQWHERSGAIERSPRRYHAETGSRMPRLGEVLSARIRPPVRPVSLLVPPLRVTGETAIGSRLRPPFVLAAPRRNNRRSSRGTSLPA